MRRWTPCVKAGLPLVNGSMANRATTPSHVGFLVIPYESTKYNNSFTMLLVRDFAASLQSLGSGDWSEFPSSLCPKLAAHTTKHIPTSLPGTSNESVTPFSDSSNRERKTFGSSSGPKHKEVSVSNHGRARDKTYFGHGTGARNRIGRTLAATSVLRSVVLWVKLTACNPPFSAVCLSSCAKC